MNVSIALPAGLTLSSAGMTPDVRAASVEDADVRAAANGDMDAFGRLYRSHAERIHILARRLVGSALADEATQDVFVRAWSKLALFRGDAAFATWLHRVAVNVLIRKAQSARRSEGRNEALKPTLAERAPTDPHVWLELEEALAHLDDTSRQVVVLHDMEGFNHEEVGAMLGISVSAARMRLHRARVMLRAYLTAHGESRK